MTDAHRAAGGRRALAVTILVAGLGVLAAGIATVTGPGRAPADAGTIALAEPAATGPHPTSPGTGPPGSASPGSAPPGSGSAGPGPWQAGASTPSRAGSATGSAVDRAAAARAAAAPSTPTRVVIPALRVDAAVDPVGVGAGGALGIPEDADRLGWWIGSAMPAAARGTVLIAGHVDTVADGQGALFRLETLAMGARIDVRSGDRVVAYRAVARRSYTKRRLPPDLFRSDTAPRLVLITCGGAFENGSYSHNVVLYAEPLR